MSPYQLASSNGRKWKRSIYFSISRKDWVLTPHISLYAWDSMEPVLATSGGSHHLWSKQSCHCFAHNMCNPQFDGKHLLGWFHFCLSNLEVKYKFILSVQNFELSSRHNIKFPTGCRESAMSLKKAGIKHVFYLREGEQCVMLGSHKSGELNRYFHRSFSKGYLFRPP